MDQHRIHYYTTLRRLELEEEAREYHRKRGLDPQTGKIKPERKRKRWNR